ncbi:MAG: hypothetical protein HY894_01850 [Deltaproteobacteria bacterium]|nr:hypothetical protein [Deltaproteobacteria bacterium]
MNKTGRMTIQLVCLCAVFFSSCSRPKTGVDLVKEAVTDAVASAEAKDVGGVMKRVSRGFHGDDGSDYNAVKGILLGQLFRDETVNIFIRGMEVEVKGDTAVAEVRVVMTRGKAVKSLSEVPRGAADALRFSIVFKKEDGSWKAVNAAWERIGLAGLL